MSLIGRLAERATWTRKGGVCAPRTRLMVGLTLACIAIVLSPFRLAVVVGDSMEPGFHSGDLLLLDRRAYRTTNPQRGDVVVARHQRDWLIKRIVGLPGEVVGIRRGELQINGAKAGEPYPLLPGSVDVASGKMRAGRYALMGDNRTMTSSQCVPAIVTIDDILGKVQYSLRLWPFSG